MAKKSTKGELRRKARQAGFTFHIYDGETEVYRGRKLLGTILGDREGNGRYCFRLACDTRSQPRKYRGRVKAAEALLVINKLVQEAKSKRLSPEQLIVRAWDAKPEAAPH